MSARAPRGSGRSNALVAGFVLAGALAAFSFPFLYTQSGPKVHWMRRTSCHVLQRSPVHVTEMTTPLDLRASCAHASAHAPPMLPPSAPHWLSLLLVLAAGIRFCCLDEALLNTLITNSTCPAPRGSTWAAERHSSQMEEVRQRICCQVMSHPRRPCCRSAASRQLSPRALALTTFRPSAAADGRGQGAV